MGRIGDRIKEARQGRNMTAKELGKKCGVAESYITDIEAGKKVINDSMIKRISSILNANLDESLYKDEETMQEDIREVKVKEAKPREVKAIAPEWESAFSNIIKDIPVYDIDMKNIIDHKHLPVIDKKVEGYSADKVIYISISDNTLSGFRIKKGDRVMVVLNPEPLNNGLCLLEQDGERSIKLVKRLDSDKILLLSSPDEIRAETKRTKEVKIIGHCIKAEINLNRV